ARVTTLDHLVLERIEAPRAMAHEVGAHSAATADPVLVEVFNNLFMSIAEQMGVMLANTAYSVNIKERLDFSCAVFDGDAQLVANAPHMPVHLGSMSESVQEVVRRHGARMQPGDVYALNAPYAGGTHLPDITVVMPVFLAEARPGTAPSAVHAQPQFYVAARGHHADIGGRTPGSMPCDSRHIDEEGVLLDCVQIVREGRFLEETLRAALCAGPWPARNVAQNLADLRAQVAACRKGAAEIENMVAQFGAATVHAYMGHV